MLYFPENDRSYLQPLDDRYHDLLVNSTSGQAIQKLLKDFIFDTILDVGCGAGWHTRHFANRGKTVTALDYSKHAELNVAEFSNKSVEFKFQDVMEFSSNIQFDALWCSHVLEHQPNPNLFLMKLHSLVREEGVLAITVPPLKNEIVGGHVTLWNAGLLLYQLALAGFDCREAAILKYAYNISIIVRKKTINHNLLLGFSNGDIEKLAPFLPTGNLKQGFNGNISIHNWY